MLGFMFFYFYYYLLSLCHPHSAITGEELSKNQDSRVVVGPFYLLALEWSLFCSSNFYFLFSEFFFVQLGDRAGQRAKRVLGVLQ